MSETKAEPQSNPAFPDTDRLEWFLEEVHDAAWKHHMNPDAEKRMFALLREHFGQNLPEPRFGYKKKPPTDNSS